MPTPAQSEQLKFLLADFNAIKAEIARRSTSQRIALGAYSAVVAFVFKESGSLPFHLAILTIWVPAILSLLFWAPDMLPFFVDALEFVFAASDLIEAGWDANAWSIVPTTMTHPFSRFRVGYIARLQQLKNLLKPSGG
jgi:hypothetical protein